VTVPKTAPVAGALRTIPAWVTLMFVMVMSPVVTEIAESYGARVVSIPSEEFTFGRSLNYGIREATNEYLVIASAHVYPLYPDWLASLLHPLLDKQVALSYGRQRGPESARFSEKQIFHQWFPEMSNLHQETAFCNNANAALKKSLWKKHPYDETFNLHFYTDGFGNNTRFIFILIYFCTWLDL
jgi:hypothetical protein